jgi:hypothetical protein
LGPAQVGFIYYRAICLRQNHVFCAKGLLYSYYIASYVARSVSKRPGQKKTLFFRASSYHHEQELDESFRTVVIISNLDEFERGLSMFKVYVFVASQSRVLRQNHVFYVKITFVASKSCFLRQNHVFYVKITFLTSKSRVWRQTPLL